MNKQELAEFLYENFYNRGTNTIDLSGLDFSGYRCNVSTSGMVSDMSIDQSDQKAGRTIYQSECEAEFIYQDIQMAHSIFQREHSAKYVCSGGQAV